MATQDYTISHTGTVLDPDNSGNVALSQNQVSPQRLTEIIEFTCPENFDTVSWVGNRDPVYFVPRTMETATATDDDGSAALEEGERTFALSADIIPPTGETEVADQPYYAVEAVNVTQGTEIAQSDLTVDYAANEVTVADSAVAIDDDLKFYPIITEGTFHMRGLNALGQTEGPVYPYGFPLVRWHDMPQDKRGTEINLNGSISWDRNETLEVQVDSPRQVVWEDADHPDAYVTTLEIDVEITF